MNPRQFQYHAPKTIQEALTLIEQHGPDGKILAGGQSLLPMMKLRLVSPAHLIDLGKIPDLAYIRVEGEILRVGAMTTLADIERSETVKTRAHILSQCARTIADPLIRNVGTVGGNVCHSDPNNDLPAVMVACDARMEAVSARGKRTIPASEFFVDTFTTALAEGELLVGFEIPTGPRRWGAYAKLERQAGDFGIVGVAVMLEFSDDGECTSCGVGLSGAGPTVVKARGAEEALKGTRLERRAVEKAAAAASHECDPTSDLRGSVGYKREMVGIMLERAVKTALEGD